MKKAYEFGLDPALIEFSFTVTDDFFRDAESSQNVGVMMYVHGILEFVEDPELEHHKIFLNLLFSPVMSEKIYDVRIEGLQKIYDESCNLKFMLLHPDIVKILQSYISEVEIYLKDLGEEENIDLEMSVKKLKKDFFCPDLRSLESKMSNSLPEIEKVRRREKHKMMYSSSLDYPSQYLVFLGIMLKLFIFCNKQNSGSVFLRSL